MKRNRKSKSRHKFSPRCPDHGPPDFGPPSRNPGRRGGLLYPAHAKGIGPDEPSPAQSPPRHYRRHRAGHPPRHRRRTNRSQSSACHRDPRCKSSPQDIAAALQGHYRSEHLFVLGQNLELYDFYHDQIRACDQQIQVCILELEAPVKAPDLPLPPAQPGRRLRPNEPQFDIRSPLFVLSGGADLTQLPGIGPYNDLKLVAEIGLDMHHWPTPKHFVSWLTLAPNNKISGGKILSSKTQPSANRASTILRLAAMAIGRSDHALGAFCRRLGARIGKAKAITATARKLAILVYLTLRDKLVYSEQSAASYVGSQRKRMLRGLRKRAKSLGCKLVDTSTGLAMG